MHTESQPINKPTQAYVAASWSVLAIGVICYLVGLWNASIAFNEKGFYFTVFILGIFSAVTLQKVVRDKEEGLATTNIFFAICWAAFSISVALLVIGLFNAQMPISEKGFYGIAFVLSLFAVITVQKNIRDLINSDGNSNGNTNTAAFPSFNQVADVAMETSDSVND